MKRLKISPAWLVSGVLSVVTPLAHAVAPAVGVTGSTDALVAPASTAVTSFTVGFSTPYQLTSLQFRLDFDAALLTFNQGASSVSVNDTSYTLPYFLAELGGWAAAQPGAHVSAGQVPPASGTGLTELYLDANFGTTGLALLPSTVIVRTAFDLVSPTFAAGMSQAVRVTTLWLADVSLNPIALATADAPVIMTISAIPEPQPWYMLLAGLGLLGAVARRRVG